MNQETNPEKFNPQELIKNIWKDSFQGEPTADEVAEIIKQAEVAHAQSVSNGTEHQLGTFVSWYTRQYIEQQKSLEVDEISDR